jgi:hypothetical protein
MSTKDCALEPAYTWRFKTMTDIKFGEGTRDWTVYVKGSLLGYHTTCAEALELLDECTAKYEQHALL